MVYIFIRGKIKLTEKGKKPIALLSLILFLIFSAVSASIENQTQHNFSSRHFVLVHGACSGAWNWYKIVPPLKMAGHRVTAIDLAASGINLSRVNDIKSYSDYSKLLIDFMDSLPLNHKIILVGHAYGGASISQAMELFPNKISVAVFLTAIMPGPSLPFSNIFQQATRGLISALDNKVTYDDGPNNPPTTFIFGPKYKSQVLYQFSPSEDAALAILLARPIRLVTGEELVFTEAKYGSVKRVFIIAEQDRVLPIDIQQMIIKRNPPNKVVTIRGSDHNVMTSQPVKLLAHLFQIAKDFA